MHSPNMQKASSKRGFLGIGSGGRNSPSLVDRQHPVAGPAGELRSSQIAPGDLVAAKLVLAPLPMLRIGAPAAETASLQVRIGRARPIKKIA